MQQKEKVALSSNMIGIHDILVWHKSKSLHITNMRSLNKVAAVCLLNLMSSAGKQ